MRDGWERKARSSSSFYQNMASRAREKRNNSGTGTASGWQSSDPGPAGADSDGRSGRKSSSVIMSVGGHCQPHWRRHVIIMMPAIMTPMMMTEAAGRRRPPSPLSTDCRSTVTSPALVSRDPGRDTPAVSDHRIIPLA